MTRTVKILLGVAAGVLLLLVAGSVTAFWMVRSAVDVEPVSDAEAQRTFDEIRMRFGELGPVFTLANGDELVVSRELPAESAPEPVSRIRVLTWDRDGQQLVRIEAPIWMMRWQGAEIDVSRGSNGPRRKLPVSDIERYGPALLFDHEEDSGSRLLVWTE
jgi:hypothetical protein